MPDGESRDNLIVHLKSKGILAVFHYISLHSSPYYTDKHDGRELPNSDQYSDCLVRLPLFYELTEEEQAWVVEAVKEAVKVKQ
jgi:dTDP-4-amino-4,6-dideoxygalactose transaminase